MKTKTSHKTKIKIIDLQKEFEGHWVTRGVNLDIPEGLMTVIIGRSGEGKSVLLKQVIGLIKPTSGSIIVDGWISHNLKVKSLMSVLVNLVMFFSLQHY